MCCMKEYHVFTFSNMSAFKRVMAKVKGIKCGVGGAKGITGFVAIINKWNVKQDQPREHYSYEELFDFWNSQFPWIYCDEIEFHGWEDLSKIYLQRKSTDDVFGRVEVELR